MGSRGASSGRSGGNGGASNMVETYLPSVERSWSARRDRGGRLVRTAQGRVTVSTSTINKLMKASPGSEVVVTRVGSSGTRQTLRYTVKEGNRGNTLSRQNETVSLSNSSLTRFLKGIDPDRGVLLRSKQ